MATAPLTAEHGAEARRPARIEIGWRPGMTDARGEQVAHAIQEHLGFAVASVATRRIFLIDATLTPEELEHIRREFTDPVIEESDTPRLAVRIPFDWMIIVGFRPGVTDNLGRTARSALGDILGRPPVEDETVHTETAYLIYGAELRREQVERIGRDLLANTLIETVDVLSWPDWEAGAPAARAPKARSEAPPRVQRIDLSGSDEDLLRISREGVLSLSLAEMNAIRDYFRSPSETAARAALGLDERPTDVELEMLAQTWSEHCKHKIFDALIRYEDGTGGRHEMQSLFKSYIKAATAEVARRKDWLVSVFHDNAGVIAFNERLDLVYKVETHNSPSALEPYGGAMTGIVGCNRDPMGTGMGAELLINVWGYCFASPFYDQPLPEGVMHPRRLRDGVHKGVIDGGNQSGIPYGVGWEFYDDRYLAKPMVYCGTLGTLPKHVAGRPGHEKQAHPGDLVVMVGGRIGKDGIHGATFSSEELHKDSPVQAVQIGDPITQKKMGDFLIEARDAGLYRCITDNGAGGLSSSVGEMARDTGGVEIDLARAPLKYAGLQPWEIWLSEAQERMTLAVSPDQWEALSALARRRDVEVTALGIFNDSGTILLKYGNETVGRIGIEFLHGGCPRMELPAKWTPPRFDPLTVPQHEQHLDEDVRQLLMRLNICSKEFKCRQYDHEVKGRTVLKPLIGVERDVPSDATVFLAEYGGREGIVLSHGFNSHLSDLDTYAMIQWSVDLAVRRILAVGGRLDYIAGLDNFCWPDPVESPATPDGAYKLAQLVRANEALYDICVAYGVPLISGKDSMKNDSTRGGKKISVPPSVLFSAVGKLDDVGGVVTIEAKAIGDLVYVLGETRAELGASEYAWMLSERAGRTWENPAIGGAVPRLDTARALELYRAVEAAARAGEIRSLHAPGLGGLAVAFTMIAFGGEVGLQLDLDALPTEGELRPAEILFSESNARFVATVAPEMREVFEQRFKSLPCACVGEVTAGPQLTIHGRGAPVVNADLFELKTAWQSVLDGI